MGHVISKGKLNSRYRMSPTVLCSDFGIPSLNQFMHIGKRLSPKKTIIDMIGVSLIALTDIRMPILKKMEMNNVLVNLKPA